MRCRDQNQPSSPVLNLSHPSNDVVRANVGSERWIYDEETHTLCLCVVGRKCAWNGCFKVLQLHAKQAAAGCPSVKFGVQQDGAGFVQAPPNLWEVV